MMSIEAAIEIGFRRCDALARKIEAIERNKQAMDGFDRRELGAWRRLLNHAGVAHDQLPEVPFLEPAHLEAYKKNREAARERRSVHVVEL